MEPALAVVAVGTVTEDPVELVIMRSVVPWSSPRLVPSFTWAPSSIPASLLFSVGLSKPAFTPSARGRVASVPVSEVIRAELELRVIPRLVDPPPPPPPARAAARSSLSWALMMPGRVVLAGGRVTSDPVELLRINSLELRVTPRLVPSFTWAPSSIPASLLFSVGLSKPAFTPSARGRVASVPVSEVIRAELELRLIPRLVDPPARAAARSVLSWGLMMPGRDVLAGGRVTSDPVELLTVKLLKLLVTPRLVPSFTWAPSSIPASLLFSVGLSKPAFTPSARGRVASVPVSEVIRAELELRVIPRLVDPPPPPPPARAAARSSLSWALMIPA